MDELVASAQRNDSEHKRPLIRRTISVIEPSKILRTLENMEATNQGET